MNVIIAGGTGMIGSLVLAQCLNSDKIKQVISLVRKPTGKNHRKLTEVIIENFEDYSSHNSLFQNIDVTFFCVGVYTGQVKNALFKKITVDYAVQFAAAVEKNSPQSTFCLLSGAGADRKEKSKAPFARFKGMAENKIQKMNLNFYTFRPAYIYPVTPRDEPNMLYKASRILYPLIKLFGNNASITSVELATALFNVGINGADKEILENRDILSYI